MLTAHQIERYIPDGLAEWMPNRARVLQVALSQVGTREATGRNDGPVEQYLPKHARGQHKPYCAFFGGWCVCQALTRHPYARENMGGVWDVFQAAKRFGELHLPSDAVQYLPQPGDWGIILHDKDGNLDTRDSGHLVTVLRVSPEGQHLNCVEGNWRNQIGVTTRDVDDFNGGFVNFYRRMCGAIEHGSTLWQRGLIDAPLAGGLAGTR